MPSGVQIDPGLHWEQISRLMAIGRERAGVWLEANFDRLGKESSIDIRAKYL